MNPSTAEISQFILDSFDNEAFEVFCEDYFHAARADFPSNMALRDKSQRLIAYCEGNGVLDNLRANLRAERPEAYARRFPAVHSQPHDVAAVGESIKHNPRQVFISHTGRDAEFAHKLAHSLVQHGWRVWIAPNSILPGEKWLKAIMRGLKESGIFLVVLTPDAIKSDWVNDEYSIAINFEKQKLIKLIPLALHPLLQDDVPPELSLYQTVSFGADKYDEGLSELLTGLDRQVADSRENQAKVETPRLSEPKAEQAQVEIAHAAPRKLLPRWVVAGSVFVALAVLVALATLLVPRGVQPLLVVSPAVASSAISSDAITATTPGPIPSPSGITLKPTMSPAGEALTATPWLIAPLVVNGDNPACSQQFTLAPEPDRPRAVKIACNCGQGGYCGLKFPLGGYDASGKATLSIWVRSEQGGEQIDVGVKDTRTLAGLEPKLTQNLTSSWGVVSIPLAYFIERNQDMSALDNFSLVFTANGKPVSGTLYVDAFTFDKH